MTAAHGVSDVRRELFVYYRIADADEAAAADALRHMQEDLVRSHPGLLTRRLRRPGSSDGLQTWMETYALPGPGVDAVVEADIASAARALEPWTRGARHIEVFTTSGLC